MAIALSRPHRRNTPYPFNKVRIRFGTWLALALEFQLGSHILATTIAPTLEELGKLAPIAVVRTFLNYFLNQELKTNYKLDEKKYRYHFSSVVLYFLLPSPGVGERLGVREGNY